MEGSEVYVLIRIMRDYCNRMFYYDYSIEGVYSSREKAETAMRKGMQFSIDYGHKYPDDSVKFDYAVVEAPFE